MLKNSIQLIAVQARWSLAAYECPESFAREVERWMRMASAVRRPECECLIAFPEFIGLPLLFMGHLDQVRQCKTWREAAGRVIGGRMEAVQCSMAAYGVGPLRALYLARSEELFETYHRVFQAAAVDHQCWIVGGSVPLPSGTGGKPASGEIYNVSGFFGPSGLAGMQAKVHPYGPEGSPEGLDIVPESPQNVCIFESRLGRLGIPICYDAWQDDVMEALAAQGAQIVVQPSANPRAWDEWQEGDWKRGLWHRLQQHPEFQYGVNPMMVGWLFAADDEYSCQGRSSIVAKAAATADGSGYLARASEQPWGRYTVEEVVSAVVSRP